MNRTFLMVMLALDLIVMGMSSYLIWDSIQKRPTPKSSPQIAQPSQVTPTPPNQTAPPRGMEPRTGTDPAATGKSVASSAVTKEIKETAKIEERAEKKAVSLKKVLFQYRDSVPKEVAIAGNFNQWNPQLMKKNQKHLWAITLQLAPGEYVYNFIVDGKMIRDPSNRKNKNAGQKIPSSLLIVKSK